MDGIDVNGILPAPSALNDDHHMDSNDLIKSQQMVGNRELLD